MLLMDLEHRDHDVKLLKRQLADANKQLQERIDAAAGSQMKSAVEAGGDGGRSNSSGADAPSSSSSSSSSSEGVKVQAQDSPQTVSTESFDFTGAFDQTIGAAIKEHRSTNGGDKSSVDQSVHQSAPLTPDNTNKHAKTGARASSGEAAAPGGSGEGGAREQRRKQPPQPPPQLSVPQVVGICTVVCMAMLFSFLRVFLTMECAAPGAGRRMTSDVDDR